MSSLTIGVSIDAKAYELALSCLEDQEWFARLPQMERDRLAHSLAVRLRGCADFVVQGYANKLHVVPGAVKYFLMSTSSQQI